MRTKTLLLAAAALFTAGYTSLQAQVYSQNVVGYANIATPNSGSYYMICVPFSIGVSNGANEIWPLVSGQPSIPDGSSLLIWNVASQKFTTYLSDSTSPSLWDDYTGSPIPNSPRLPVGQGFFLNLASPNVTNVFAGTIAVNVGTSNVMSFTSSGTYYMAGAAVPYAGAVTNGNNQGGGLNLNGLPDGSSLLAWNPATQKFVTYLSDSTSPSLWDDYTGTPIATPPTLNVGQGFFLNLTGAYSWINGL